ncbi:MAG: hypothetical protein MRZ65_09050 [Lachnospiraceae bacterium]|nr:hypothetical protein [Lachnospiraceae bacterium]
MKFLINQRMIVTGLKESEYNVEGKTGISRKLGLTDSAGDQTGEVKCSEEIANMFKEGKLQRFKEYDFCFAVDTDRGARIVNFVPVNASK